MIIIYRSEIYCPILTLSSTIPSVLRSQREGIIGWLCLFLLIRILVIPIFAFIPVDIAGYQVKPIEFTSGQS